MEYQFVFGNPIRGIAKKENPRKMKRKGKTSMKKKKKVVKKRANPSSKSKHKKVAKKRNPYVWSAITPKGRRIKGKKKWYTADEELKMVERAFKAKQKLDAGPNKPDLVKKLTKAIERTENLVKSNNFRAAIANKEKDSKNWAAKGYSIEPFDITKKRKTKKKGATMAKRKKKSGKKKSVKSALPKGYQKWPKKGIKSGTKKVRKLRRKKTIKYAVGKGKKQRKYSLRRNPGLFATMTSGFAPARSQAETYVGSLTELSSLALGGATYGLVQQTALKYFPGIYKFAEKIPGIGPIVGPATPTLLIGIALHKLGDMKKIDTLKMVGRGLLGASVVGMSMALTKKVMPMAGIPEGLGEGDFEGIPSGMGEVVALGEGEDFEGVEAFSGVEAFGEADFEGVEAFSGIPEGLGQGQLG